MKIIQVIFLNVIMGWGFFLFSSSAQALDWSKVSDATVENYGGYANLQVYDDLLYLSIDYKVLVYDGDEWSDVYTSYEGQIRSMTSFDNQLFISVSGSWSSGAKVLAYNGNAWTQINNDGFDDADNYEILAMDVYDGKLYVGTTNSNGAEIWAYDGDGWTRIEDSGMGDSDNTTIYCMAAQEGVLYMTTSNSTTGTQVLAYDGSSWTQVNTGGFGDVNDYYAESIISYDGRLYVGTGQRGRVWAYDGSDWTQVNTDRFGNWNNVSINSFVVYADKLYASISNEYDGVNVMVYDGEAWSQDNESGFGDLINALGGMGKWLAVYEQKIYAVSAEWECTPFCKYKNTRVWSALSPDIVIDEEEQNNDENNGGVLDDNKDDSNLKKANVTSWKAYQYENINLDKCFMRVKVTIKGKNFAKNPEVRIGGQEASSVNRKSSKEITAKFCMDKILASKDDHIKTLSVQNSGTKRVKAKKDIDVDHIPFLTAKNMSFDMNSVNGIKNIQMILYNNELLDHGSVTGIMDLQTENAIIAFQSIHGLPRTGFVGPLTIAQLREDARQR